MDSLSPQKPSFSRICKKYAATASVGILLVISFIAGAAVDQRYPLPKFIGTGQVYNRNTPPPYILKDVDFGAFWDVWQTVKTRSVRQPVSDVKLFYGAMSGVVDSLGDPYSVFFDPEVAQKFNQEIDGAFGGIGAEIGVKKNQLTVIAPLPGTPAERAGIAPGDFVLAIDGVDTTGLAVEEAVAKIRGPKGTVVKLLMFRESWKQPKEISLTRDTIVVESVKWKMVTVSGKKIAVLTLTEFNRVADAKFVSVVQAITLQNPDALILDLRNNPGGFLDTAVQVAGQWLPSGTVVVSAKYSDGKVKTYPSTSIPRFANLPTVVLVNGGSASASEIVSGALQDFGKARLIGEKTFGKGSVQDLIDYDDGSELKLTIALWYTPKDRSIDKEGITPDEVVKRTSEDVDANKDPQFDRAVQYLLAPSVPVAASAGKK